MKRNKLKITFSAVFYLIYLSTVACNVYIIKSCIEGDMSYYYGSLIFLHSKAAKSWYGNYNYLVISDKLRREIEDKNEDITSYLPNGVGLIVCNVSNCSTKTVIKPKKQILSEKTVELLKDSMIRSMFYKIRRLEKNA